MTAVLLFIVWTVVALGVGLVVGRIIRNADDHEANR